MDLINDLLGQGGRCYHSAGALYLCDRKGSVFIYLCERESQVSHSGNVLFAGFCIVSACCLTAALQQMSHHCSLAELIPVIHCPSELIDSGSHENSGVSHTAGDDDVSALLESFDDAFNSKICVS